MKTFVAINITEGESKMLNQNISEQCNKLKLIAFQQDLDQQCELCKSQEGVAEMRIDSALDAQINHNHEIKKSNMKIDFLCNDTITVYSYPELFSQIFINLINNSIMHAYEKNKEGFILIRVVQKINYIKIIYKDDGKGISKENLHKIFNPFYTTNRIDGSVGLGLNVIYNVVQNNLQGNINYYSRENKGTIFVITIPMLINS